MPTLTEGEIAFLAPCGGTAGITICIDYATLLAHPKIDMNYYLVEIATYSLRPR
jgi:hypothetical protein